MGIWDTEKTKKRAEEQAVNKRDEEAKRSDDEKKTRSGARTEEGLIDTLLSSLLFLVFTCQLTVELSWMFFVHHSLTCMDF